MNAHVIMKDSWPLMKQVECDPRKSLWNSWQANPSRCKEGGQFAQRFEVHAAGAEEPRVG